LRSVPKERKGYPDRYQRQEWKLVEPLLPGVARTGRPRKVDLRQVINALRYWSVQAANGACCRNDFPPYQTVYYWFRRLIRRFLFRTIHDLALMLDRMCEQREVVPSAGIVDSQSVKAPGARERGYDAHKKVSGRKRHIAVDTDGRLLAVNLTSADIADSTGAQLVLDAWSSVGLGSSICLAMPLMTGARCWTRPPISTLRSRLCEACKAGLAFKYNRSAGSSSAHLHG
jgi:putative transposase